MTWHGSLALRYRREPHGTIAHDRHEGPLRVLRALYPEGPDICHHVFVHPPGGIVGGDTLDVRLELDANSHALITTPGATRFYRSAGPTARQTVHASLGDDARLEWLPLETLVYDGAQAVNAMRFELAPSAEMIGWDTLVLGLPASEQPFANGCYRQEIEVPGLWLERGLLDFGDPAARTLTQRLLDSPLGWAGDRVLSTVWFAAGGPQPAARLDALLEAARAVLDGASSAMPGVRGGATALHERLVVVRLLTARTEGAWPLMQHIRRAWRRTIWNLDEVAPRVWRT